MKTFKEFILCLEKYYRPDEKLPSGRTPLEKHTGKRERTSGERGENLQSKTSKVARGANNRELDLTPHEDLDIQQPYKTEPGYRIFHHKPSGVSYHIDSGSGTHNVAWMHDKEKEGMSHSERMGVIKNAKKVWKQHIEPRFPYRDVLENEPSRNEKGGSKNTRARVYQKFGFGTPNRDNLQYARVGRQPSPKQAAKGKTRLTPIQQEPGENDED